jgi:hypothetical protein
VAQSLLCTVLALMKMQRLYIAGLFLPATLLLSGCITVGLTTLGTHKTRLASFAARKDALVESRAEEIGAAPVRVSTIQFSDLKTQQIARGIEIAVRLGGYSAYVDEPDIPPLMLGVDEICGTELKSPTQTVLQKFWRTRDGIGVSISNQKTVTPCWIEIGGETVHVSLEELKRFALMLHEAQAKLNGGTGE